MRSHLDDDEVQDLLRGAVTPDGMAFVHEHIGTCDACRELLAEAVRLVPPPPATPPPPAPPPSEEPMRVVIRDGKVSRKPATPRVASAAAVRASPPRVNLGLSPGMLIADRYRLERPLGEGGSGVVWAATHTMMQRQAALKFLKTGRADAVKRFFREARVSAALHHPNIVEVHDVFMMPGTETPVMVMDLLKGESLGARLRRVGKLSAAEAARLLLPVVLALGAAHALGVVHRDLKPENIFLEGAETGDGLLVTREVRVLDFGLAKLTASEGSMATTSRLTRSGVVLGTPQYLAPEQVTASENVDQNVDVWALGVVLYECVAGRRPFVGPGLPRLFREISNETPTPLVDMTQDVPPSLSAIVARMLDKTPAARPHLALVHEVLATCASF